MMKKRSYLMVLAGFIFLTIPACNSSETGETETSSAVTENQTPAQTENSGEIKDGDLIFQTSRSSQSQAVQQATHSKYSHMGIVYQKNGKLYVYEAVQPVKLTPLQEWVRRGENGHYVVKRLKNAESVLTPEVLAKMKSAGEKYKNKDYDLYFEWSDERIYCSELVWKIYQEATGIEIGELEELRDFDLSGEAVKQKIKERYGDDIPLSEKVISPSAMFNSDQLITVLSE